MPRPRTRGPPVRRRLAERCLLRGAARWQPAARPAGRPDLGAAPPGPCSGGQRGRAEVVNAETAPSSAPTSGSASSRRRRAAHRAARLPVRGRPRTATPGRGGARAHPRRGRRALVMMWLGGQLGLSAYQHDLAASADGTRSPASLALGAKSAPPCGRGSPRSSARRRRGTRAGQSPAGRTAPGRALPDGPRLGAAPRRPPWPGAGPAWPPRWPGPGPAPGPPSGPRPRRDRFALGTARARRSRLGRTGTWVAAAGRLAGSRLARLSCPPTPPPLPG